MLLTYGGQVIDPTAYIFAGGLSCRVVFYSVFNFAGLGLVGQEIQK